MSTSGHARRRWALSLHTLARRRMAVIIATSIAFYIFTAGIDVLLPLWATGRLGLSAGDWAHLRSLRFIGALVGTVLLGACADRFGQRIVAILVMLAAAGTTALLCLPHAAVLWTLMPILGALISTSFVTLNTLTQDVSTRRQGLANALYRSVSTAIAAPAPALCTWISRGPAGYTGAFLVLAACVATAAACMRAYPVVVAPPPFAGWRQEWRSLLMIYHAPLHNRDLMRMIVLSLVLYAFLSAPATFMVVRFSLQLGQSDQQVGAFCSLAALCAFAATATSGLWLDRAPLRAVTAGGSIAAALCGLILGVTDCVWLSAAAFAANTALSTMLFSPLSMWLSRTAGPEARAGAFAVHKMVGTGSLAVAALAFAVLERSWGIRPVLLFCGATSLFLAAGFLLLPEPPRTLPIPAPRA